MAQKSGLSKCHFSLIKLQQPVRSPLNGLVTLFSLQSIVERMNDLGSWLDKLVIKLIHPQKFRVFTEEVWGKAETALSLAGSGDAAQVKLSLDILEPRARGRSVRSPAG